MDNEKLLNSISTMSNDSFIYALHYHNKFDNKKFGELKKAFKYYLNNNCNMDVEIKKQVVSSLIVTFEHLIFLFLCDESNKDLFKLNPKISFSRKSDIYLEIRNMTDELLNNIFND